MAGLSSLATLNFKAGGGPTTSGAGPSHQILRLQGSKADIGRKSRMDGKLKTV